MKKQPIQSATSLPLSPDAERSSRMRKYIITMSIRVVCFVVACLMPRSWWTLIPLAGAILLPYVAVVSANTISRTSVRSVERPGFLVPISHPDEPGSGK